MGLGLRSLSKRERSWVLYDVGNSAYVMLAATLIPIYFSAIAEPGSSAVVAWGYATTVASLALALLMPFLGSLADLKGNKKKFLAGTIGTGAVSLAVMGVPGNAMVFLAIYVFSSVMLNASLVFYDAFLVDATEQDRYDEVSSQGYAWGYIGSCIPFIVCLVIVLFGSSFGIGQLDGIRISFVITAAWWLVFSVPVLRDVHQTHFKAREEHLFRHTLKGLVGTCKKIARDKRLLMFMLAFFFYIDGVHTIITMSTSYGTDLGIDSTQLVLALLVTQFVAFPSAIAYGRLAGRFGTKRMLLIAVFAYFCITLFAAFFLREALEPFAAGQPVRFCPFDCSAGVPGSAVEIPAASFAVVEGSYSLHPSLREHYTASVFVTCAQAVQRTRLTARGGADSWAVFEARWIPLEETYFKAHAVQALADLTLDTTPFA